MFTLDGDAGVHHHSQRRGRRPGVQPYERVRIPREDHQPQCRPVHRGRPAHTQRMVQLPEVHPRTVRLTERSPRAQNPDAKTRGTRNNVVRLRHREPARVPLRCAAPSPPQLPEPLHRLAKEQSHRPAWGARKESRGGVSWMASELSVSTPTSGRLQPRTRGNGGRRWNKERNGSW